MYAYSSRCIFVLAILRTSSIYSVMPLPFSLCLASAIHRNVAPSLPRFTIQTSNPSPVLLFSIHRYMFSSVLFRPCVDGAPQMCTSSLRFPFSTVRRSLFQPNTVWRSCVPLSRVSRLFFLFLFLYVRTYVVALSINTQGCKRIIATWRRLAYYNYTLSWLYYTHIYQICLWCEDVVELPGMCQYLL